MSTIYDQSNTEAGTGAEMRRFVKNEFDAFIECEIVSQQVPAKLLITTSRVDADQKLTA